MYSNLHGKKIVRYLNGNRNFQQMIRSTVSMNEHLHIFSLDCTHFITIFNGKKQLLYGYSYFYRSVYTMMNICNAFSDLYVWRRTRTYTIIIQVFNLSKRISADLCNSVCRWTSNNNLRTLELFKYPSFVRFPVRKI